RIMWIAACFGNAVTDRFVVQAAIGVLSPQEQPARRVGANGDEAFQILIERGAVAWFVLGQADGSQERKHGLVVHKVRAMEGAIAFPLSRDRTRRFADHATGSRA